MYCQFDQRLFAIFQAASSSRFHKTSGFFEETKKQKRKIRQKFSIDFLSINERQTKTTKDEKTSLF